MTTPEHLRHQRLYSDREVSVMLKRASELQEQTRDEGRQGLPFDQIEPFARQLGIDAETLRAAAVELEQRELEHGALSFWGGPFSIVLKRVAPGPLTAEKRERILATLRHPGSGNGAGEAADIEAADIIVSRRAAFAGRLDIRVTPRNGETTIRLRKSYRGVALVAYAFALILGLAVVSPVAMTRLPPWADAILIAGGLVSAVLLARLFLVAWTRRQRRMLRQLADRLRDLSSAS